MKKGLLDEIAKCIDSYCLSNLHTMECRGAVYAAVLGMEPSGYPVSEWNQAVSYILSEPVLEFKSQEEARQYLLARLDA